MTVHKATSHSQTPRKPERSAESDNPIERIDRTGRPEQPERPLDPSFEREVTRQAPRDMPVNDPPVHGGFGHK